MNRRTWGNTRPITVPALEPLVSILGAPSEAPKRPHPGSPLILDRSEGVKRPHSNTRRRSGAMMVKPFAFPAHPGPLIRAHLPTMAWVSLLLLLAGLCSLDEAATRPQGTTLCRSAAVFRGVLSSGEAPPARGGAAGDRGVRRNIAAGAAGGLGLRGGGGSEYAEDDDALGRDLDDALQEIREARKEWSEDQQREAQEADRGEPKFLGISPRMLPMTDEPNARVMPNNFYDQFDDASSSELQDSEDPHNMERWVPSYGDLDAAMNMLGDARAMLDGMSPDGIDKLCTDNNATIEDIRPIMNSLGTRIGNLTGMEEVRQRALGKIEDIKFTHDLLKHHMDSAESRTSATQELEKEIASMTEKDVHPAIALLHEWEKNKKHEHESGDFIRQQEERNSKGAEQGLAAPSKPIPAPVAPIGVPRAAVPAERASMHGKQP